MTSPAGAIAPELKRLRKLLARRKRAPIRIIITTDPTAPVRTLTIPRFVPLAFLVASTILVFASIGLSFSTWSMSGTVSGLKNRVMAMMQLADNMAMSPLQSEAGGNTQTGSLHLSKPIRGQGRFSIETANASEQVEVVLDIASGDLDEASYRAVRRLMRCRRTGAEFPIDPRLIELLYNLSQRAGQRITLISGYRGPGFATPSSYHLRGMAADIRIPGMTALMVRDLAHAIGVHGIGYYPRSQFVHVDVRDEPFFWTDLGTGESGPEAEPDVAKAETDVRSGPTAEP